MDMDMDMDMGMGMDMGKGNDYRNRPCTARLPARPARREARAGTPGQAPSTLFAHL